VEVEGRVAASPQADHPAVAPGGLKGLDQGGADPPAGADDHPDDRIGLGRGCWRDVPGFCSLQGPDSGCDFRDVDARALRGNASQPSHWRRSQGRSAPNLIDVAPNPLTTECANEFMYYSENLRVDTTRIITYKNTTSNKLR